MIRAEGLSFSYRLGGKSVGVVRDVSFSIPEGAIAAVQGPSGSGKSTLFYLLGGLLRPDSGSIEIAGTRVDRLSRSELALFRNREIGFVFQQFHLLPRANVIENICLPAAYPAEQPRLAGARDRALALAARVGLADVLDHLPNQLSGGQQQRVAIARALLGSPRLILADEPTGNLDSATSAQILDLLAELNAEGRTIVLITHDPDVAGRCGVRLTMRDGELAADVGGSAGGARGSAGGAASTSLSVAQHPRRASLPRLVRALLPLAWENLRRNRARSVLTMAGITLGIAALLAMLTFGIYVKRKIMEGYESLGANRILLRANANWERKAKDRAFAPFLELSWERDIEPLFGLYPGILRASPVHSSWNPVISFGGVQVEREKRPRVFGVAPEYFTISNREIALGSLFTRAHVDARIGACVIGPEIATRLLSGRDPIGQTLFITAGEEARFTCRVIGVMRSVSSSSDWQRPDSEVYLPDSYFRSVAKSWEKALTSVAIQVEPGTPIEEFRKALKGYFSRRYGAAASFSVDGDSLMVDQIRRFLTLFALLLGSIATISLAIGGMGINNMMLVSVSERLKEIGLRKAVGATDRSVRVQLLLESMLLCLLAGALGILIGVALYQAVIFGASRFLSKIPFEWAFEPVAFVFSVASILAVGLLSGLTPALKAERLQVVEALRSE